MLYINVLSGFDKNVDKAKIPGRPKKVFQFICVIYKLVIIIKIILIFKDFRLYILSINILYIY